MRFLTRLLINAAALWVAVRIVHGLEFTGGPINLLGLALVFGVLNAIVRPLLVFFSFPIVFLTLGLFTFILNAVVLWLTSAFSHSLGIGFQVHGFGAAFKGALVVSAVSFFLSLLIAKDDDRE